MNSSSKRLLYTCVLASLLGGVASAQTREDFVKIAKRTISGNTGASKIAGNWHGSAFVSASSRGTTQPNLLIDYSRGRWSLHGEMSMEISRYNTIENEDIYNKDGSATKSEDYNVENYTRQNLKVSMKYAHNAHNQWTFEINDRYSKNNKETTVEWGATDKDQNPTNNRYEVKTSDGKDLSIGAQAEYKHTLVKGGFLSARLNMNYSDKPTDVDYVQWAVNSALQKSNDKQNYHSYDPKAQIAFQSPVWKGFSFSLKEDIGVVDTKVDNNTSDVNFRTNDFMTSAEAKWKMKSTSANVFASFDCYEQTVNLVDVNKYQRTFHDWKWGASVQQTINTHHSINISYDNLFKRPTYMQLYPLVHVGTNGIGTPLKGNPNLDPSRNYSATLKYTFKQPKWKLETIVSFKNITNDISKVSFKDENGKKYKTWINDAEYNIVKMELNGEVKSGSFDMTMGAHAQYLDYSGDKVRNDNAWSFSFKARPRVHLRAGWTLACVATFTGKEVHQYYYNRSNIYLALRAQKVIGNWAIYGFVQDIAKADYTQVLTSANYTTVTHDNYHTRAFIIGCSYQF